MGKVLGGLLGAASPAPAPAPQVIREVAPQQKKEVSPQQTDKVAEARKRRLAATQRTGRSALRIDLASGPTQTRSGVSIQ